MPSYQLLHAALNCPTPEGFWGLPLLLWGEPGTGKTSQIGSIGRNFAAYERLSPGERGEGQFGVVPVPGADGFLHYPAPFWAQRFGEGRSGLIFVDEINTAPPALQAPLLGFVQLRTLGAHVFGPRVRLLAAANSVQDGAGAWDLAPAVANRFGHIDFSGISAGEWVSGLAGGFADGATQFDPDAEEKRVLAAWGEANAHGRGLVGGYILAQPHRLHVKPVRGAANAGRAWPSRRSWEYVAVALASAKAHNLTEVDTDELGAAFIGQAAFNEFRVWRANADLPNAADVLDGKTEWRHEPARLDRTFAVLTACAALVAPADAVKRQARGGAAWELIAKVAETSAEASIPAARALATAKLVPPAGIKTLSKIQPILVAAGVHA